MKSFLCFEVRDYIIVVFLFLISFSFIFLFIFSCLIKPLANPTQDYLGEQLIFKMEYLNITVASLNFHIMDTIRFNNQKLYHLKINARSSLSARLFFKLENVYQTYFDTHSFLPLKSIKHIHQKNIRHDLTISFDHQHQVAAMNDSIFWNIPNDCYDYFSMIYYLRALPLHPGDTIQFHLDSEYLISRVEAVVLPDHEFINVPAGTFKSIPARLQFHALKSEPRPWKTDLLTNRLAAPGSEILIWFSDNNHRLPLKISYQQAVTKTHILLESFSWGK